MILTVLFLTSVFALLMIFFGHQLMDLNQKDSIIYVVFVLLAYIATSIMPQIAMNKSLVYSVEQRTQMIIKQSENFKQH
jgi:predicted tellurium resistance membrane protein TerC